MIELFDKCKEDLVTSFIYKFYGLEFPIPGLARTEHVFSKFKKQAMDKDVKITIIGGTNGKGQTAHTLAHFLGQAGENVALWTSPHILSVRERFTFYFDRHKSDINYQELFNEIQKSHLFLLRNYTSTKLTFYEFLFLVFLNLSLNNERKINHLVLEVGLGGRLDTVNHFDANCTCLTSISRDHQTILGNRYDKILTEKLGICRESIPLFTNFKLRYLNDLTNKLVEQLQIDWRPIRNLKSDGSMISTQQNNYYKENQALALSMFKFYHPSSDIDLNSIPNFKARREEMTFLDKSLIFIGAHNIDGIRRMVESINDSKKDDFPDLILLSFSKRNEDEIKVMLKILFAKWGNNKRIVVTSFNHPKAEKESTLSTLTSHLNKFNKGMLDFVKDWKFELTKKEHQQILVCGSLYFIGEVQRYIISSRN